VQLNGACVRRHETHSARTSESDFERRGEPFPEEIFAARFPEPLNASVASDGHCMFCKGRDVADSSREPRNPEVFIATGGEKICPWHALTLYGSHACGSLCQPSLFFRALVVSATSYSQERADCVI
jgi:hypothetical protein